MEFQQYLLSTIYKTQKKILSVESYDVKYESFVAAAQMAFNINNNINFLNSHDIVIEPNIFLAYVLQFYKSPDLILKIEDAEPSNETSFVVYHSPVHIKTELHEEPVVIDSPNEQYPSLSANVYSQVQTIVPEFQPLPRSSYSENDDSFSNVPLCTQKLSMFTADNIRSIPDLEIYLISGQSLNNNARNFVAKAIIKYVIGSNYNTRLLKEDFLKLSDLIPQVWPGEKATDYYVPFSKEKIASGKLWMAYNNYRTKLRSYGLLARKTYKKTVETQNIVAPFAPEPTTSSQEGKVILQHRIPVPPNPPVATLKEQVESDPFVYMKKPFPECDKKAYIHHWETTFNLRKSLMEKCEQVENYIQQFSYFQEQGGYELAYIDSRLMYGLLNDIQGWSKYYKKVKEVLISSSNSSNLKLLELMSRLRASNEEDEKIFSLILLPHHFQFANKKRDSSGMKKQYNPKIHESFIAFFNKMGEAEAFETENNINHPRVVVIGNPVAATYLYIPSKKKYWFNDSLKAVEACFMFFMALNLDFPPDIQSTWDFLVKCVFNNPSMDSARLLSLYNLN